MQRQHPGTSCGSHPHTHPAPLPANCGVAGCQLPPRPRVGSSQWSRSSLHSIPLLLQPHRYSCAGGGPHGAGTPTPPGGSLKRCQHEDFLHGFPISQASPHQRGARALHHSGTAMAPHCWTSQVSPHIVARGCSRLTLKHVPQVALVSGPCCSRIKSRRAACYGLCLPHGLPQHPLSTCPQPEHQWPGQQLHSDRGMPHLSHLDLSSEGRGPACGNLDLPGKDREHHSELMLTPTPTPAPWCHLTFILTTTRDVDNGRMRTPRPREGRDLPGDDGGPGFNLGNFKGQVFSATALGPGLSPVSGQGTG